MCIPVPKGIIEDYLPLDMTTCQSSLLVRRSLHGIICIPVRKWIIEVYVPLAWKMIFRRRAAPFVFACTARSTSGRDVQTRIKTIVFSGGFFF